MRILVLHLDAFKELYDKVILIKMPKATIQQAYGVRILRELEEEFGQKAEWIVKETE